jgi:hypothetical protein
MADYPLIDLASFSERASHLLKVSKVVIPLKMSKNHCFVYSEQHTNGDKRRQTATWGDRLAL